MDSQIVKRIILSAVAFIIFNTPSNGAEDELRWRSIGGQEFIAKSKGIGNSRNKSLRENFINRTTEISKRIEGKLIYNVIYTVDKNGFRTSQASHLPSKTKHFFIIDGSVAFGEGLNDDQTIHHLINTRSKTYEAYELGFLGSGPQHNWLIFKNKFLPKLVKEKRGSAILITQGQDFRRLVGTIDHLIYSSRFPNLVEVTPGNFERHGNFKNNGTFLQRIFSNLCVPFFLCKTFMTKTYKNPDESQIALAARLFDSIEKMYREQFDVEDFRILWVGGDEVKIFHNLSKIKTIHVPFDRFDESHPSALGTKQIVDYLFAEKIIY